MANPGLFRGTVVAILIGAAGYQLTPLKRAYLGHCRSPLSQLLQAGYTGATRDLLAGLHHALYRIGCCWPLFVLLVAVGTMNLAAMLVLTAVVAGENLPPHGEPVARVAAGGAIVAAAALACRRRCSVGSLAAEPRPQQTPGRERNSDLGPDPDAGFIGQPAIERVEPTRQPPVVARLDRRGRAGGTIAPAARVVAA